MSRIGRNGGTMKRSGWHQGAARAMAGEFFRFELSEWEQLLVRLGIPEEHAAQAICQGWPGAAELVTFVRERATRFYVPEDVLRGLGLTDAVERSNGLAWCHLRPAWLTQGYGRKVNYAKRIGAKRGHA